MGKYSNFINPKISNNNKFELIVGNYGCQTCPKETEEAWFDEKHNLIFWICSEGHRSEIRVGV